MQDHTAACIQMTSDDDAANNLQRAADLLAAAAAGGAQLAVLPEFFPLLSADESAKLAIAEDDSDGPIQNFLSQAARQHGMHIVGGTVPIRAPAADGRPRVYAASPLYAPDGARLARYDKMHLFQYRDDMQQYDETATICPGDAAAAADTPLGRIALSVCYDLRFPELYRQLPPPDIISAPSAFTVPTGRAHWQLLLTARAVENLAYVIGAAQAGEHPGGRRTYGHSMIISPWGKVLAQAQSAGDEVIFAGLSAAELQQWRQRLPALENRRLR